MKINDKIKVDVLIPVYNEDKNLKLCLKYLKKQRYLNNIIVINDFSTDNSESIARKFGAKVIVPEKSLRERDTWAAEILNFGLSFIKTSFFLKLDADIILLKDYIYHCIKYFEKEEKIYSVSGVIPPLNPTWARIMGLVYQIYPRGGARVYKTEILRKIGGFQCDNTPTKDFRRNIMTKRGEDVITDLIASKFNYFKGIARKAKGWHLRPALRHLELNTPNRIEKMFFLLLFFKFKEIKGGINIFKNKIRKSNLKQLYSTLNIEIKSLLVRISFRIISSEKLRIKLKNLIKIDFSELRF